MAAKSTTKHRSEPQIASGETLLVDERALARAIGMSVAWLRKDRRRDRLVPFVRVGVAVRYHLPSVQRVLLARQEGGSAR